MKTYEYKGEEYNITELCKVYFSEKRKRITPDCLRYRIKARGCVVEAFNFISKATYKEKFKCPDGVLRTHNEVAEFLGISKVTLFGRYKTHSFEEAFNMGGLKKVKQEERYNSFDHIPSPTKYEESLYS